MTESRSLQAHLYEAARRHATRVALTWRDWVLTYEAFERLTNRFAHHLRERGLSPNDIVCLLIGDRINLIEAVVAVSKAGAAFAPLQAGEPDRRLEAMLRQIGPRLLVVESRWQGRLAELARRAELDCDFIALDENAAPGAALYERAGLGGGDARAFERLPVVNGPDDISYIYFTSGSTGTPKAIAGRWESLRHFVDWEIETLGVDERFRVTQLANPTFDAFLRDVFVPLCAGAAICVPDDQRAPLEARRFADWLDANRVTLMHCVPAVFRLLTREPLTADRFANLRYVMMAGERLHHAEIRRWMEVFGERIQLINLYGATENTMAKFFHFIRREDLERGAIPIGKPMAGARAILLDEQNNICEPGTVGEIHIRTPYLTHGYYKDPALTRRVFIPNPFTGDAADRVHKTGDFGRLLPDGVFELIGRRDHQVKVRGQRVELAEVEAAVKQHPAALDCAVLALGDDPDDVRLAAYVVAGAEPPIGDMDLKAFLADRLPEHMIPATFTRLDRMPLTANGKVDRRALPAPAAGDAMTQPPYVAPRTELEEQIAAIWRELLRLDAIGVHANFFQLGGHSLLATQVMSRVYDAYAVEVPLRRLFENPTIAELAEALAEALRQRDSRQQDEVLDVVENLSEEELQAMLDRLAAEGADEGPGDLEPATAQHLR